MKDFSYFMAKYDEVKKMPKGEFRDKAFETYNAECNGVELPISRTKELGFIFVAFQGHLISRLTKVPLVTSLNVHFECAIGTQIKERYI